MHAPVHHHDARNHARRLPVQLTDWLLDAALLMVLLASAAVAVAYFVLLTVT